MEDEVIISTAENGVLTLDAFSKIKRVVASFCGATALAMTPTMQLAGLTFLDISHNKLRQLPKLSDCMPSIRVARLSHNLLPNLSFCMGSTSLTELWVDHNELSTSFPSIKADLARCPALATLTIHANPAVDHALKATLLAEDDPTVVYSASYKRKSSRVVGIVSCMRAHGAATGKDADAQGASSDERGTGPPRPGTVSHPLDMYLSASIPSLTIVVTGAQPSYVQALQELSPTSTQSAQAEAPVETSSSATTTLARTIVGNARRKGAAATGTGSGGGRGKGDITPAFKQASATLARVTPASLLAARAWLDDHGPYGASAWLKLIEEASLVPHSFKEGHDLLGSKQGADASEEEGTVMQAEAVAEDGSSPRAKDAGGRTLDLSSVKAKVPSRKVAPGPARTWSTQAEQAATAGSATLPGPEGSNASSQPPAAVPARPSVDKPLPDLSKTKPTVPSRTVAPLGPHQVWNKGNKEQEKEKEQEAHKAKEVSPADAAPAPAPAAPYKPPDMSSVQAKVPSRTVAPRKAHQQWEKGKGDEDALPSTAEKNQKEASGIAAEANEAVAAATSPAPAPYRPPDMASVKPKVPARTVPPLKPHQQWQKTETTSTASEAAARSNETGVEGKEADSGAAAVKETVASPKAKLDLTTVKHSSSVASHVVPKDDRPLVWKKEKSKEVKGKEREAPATPTPSGEAQPLAGSGKGAETAQGHADNAPVAP